MMIIAFSKVLNKQTLIVFQLKLKADLAKTQAKICYNLSILRNVNH